MPIVSNPDAMAPLCRLRGCRGMRGLTSVRNKERARVCNDRGRPGPVARPGVWKKCRSAGIQQPNGIGASVTALRTVMGDGDSEMGNSTASSDSDTLNVSEPPRAVQRQHPVCAGNRVWGKGKS